MATCGKCKEQNVNTKHVRMCYGLDPSLNDWVGDRVVPDDEGEFFGGDVFEDAWPEPEQPKPEPHWSNRELEDGIYQVGDDYYMLYHTVHGANQQVAKKLTVDEEEADFAANFEQEDGYKNEGGPLGEWVYQGKSPLKRIRPEHKLSAEQAAQFGQVYGWCGRCGRTLTKEASKAAGIGPICAGKM